MIRPARIFLFALFLLVSLFPLSLLLFPLFPLSSPISPSPAFAASPAGVVINEVAWMGSSVSTADEWLELRNTTDQDIDISGWQLTRYSKIDDIYQENLMLEIPPEATVSASGYFLISNYDKNNSRLNVDPNVTNKSVSLANTKLQIKLYDGPWDSGGNLIDTADDGVGKPAAGVNEKNNKTSMARKNSPGDGTNSESWYTSTASVGFDSGAAEKGTPGSGNIDAPDENSDGELEINFTLPSSVTAGEGFDVPVTVANADPSGVYYAKAVIGESTESASLRKGCTHNPALDKWLAWNGSWSEMPSFTTNSDASFTLKSRVKDDAESGTYYYLVRIRKVGTDDNLDSDAQTFSVVASSNSSTSSDDPEVTFSVEGSEFKVNQSFEVKVNIKNATPKHDYYIKIRLGSDPGTGSDPVLTKGRTYNSRGEVWLADNASWSKFPVVYTAADGTESLTFSAKVASGNPADTYIIGVRIRDKETEKNYDSETQKIVVGAEEAASNEENDDDGAGAVLGVATELPATGGGLLGGGVTNLPAFGRFAKFWLPVIGWMILIFLGSSTHGVSVSESRSVDFLAHKIVHLFEYSVLFILLHRAVKRSIEGYSKRTTAVVKLDTLVAFVLTVGYAVTDEIHQSFVPGRDARLTDVLIDASAALLGWFAIKRFRGWSKMTTAVDKIRYPSVKTILCLVISSSLLLLTSSPAFSASHLSFSVPDGYELKEGEIDHLGGVIDIFDTRAAAVSFKPDFNFDLAGFATFVYSYEKHYGELDPSAFTLSIYEGLMEHCDLDTPLQTNAKRLITTVVEGNAGEAPTYQLFFGFDPVKVKSGQDYTAILTTTETTIGRYRFWYRSQYFDGFALTFNPQTREFSRPSSGHIGAPFGLFVQEGWQGTPPRFHPVVLIHGMGGRPSDWQDPAQDYVSLVQEMYAGDEDFDYPSSWIHSYHYGNVGWEYNYQGDIREIALGLEAVVDGLAARYAESFGETLEGLEERDEDRVVDVVGYSMGGLVARQYLIKHQDNHHIRKLVTIATPHRGIYWLGRKESIGTISKVGPKLEEAISEFWDLGVGILDQSGQPVDLESKGALQMVPDSEFLDYLNMVEWTPLDVQYSAIYGDIDIVLKEKIFFFTMEKKVALGDVFIFSESAVGIPAVKPQAFGYNEEWTFPVGIAVSPDGVSARFYIEGLDLRKFRFWHLNILHQPEIKDETVSILVDEI